MYYSLQMYVDTKDGLYVHTQYVMSVSKCSATTYKNTLVIFYYFSYIVPPFEGGIIEMNLEKEINDDTKTHEYN